MDKKIKVAYVINDVLYGGAQVAVLNIARRLDSSRFDSTVYVLNTYPQERPSLQSAYQEAGLRLEYVGTGGKTGIARATVALRTRFKTEKPDIIHAHLNDAVLASIIAGRICGIGRIVVHEHNSHSMYSWKVRAALAFLRPLVSLTVCYTPVLENELFGTQQILSPNEPFTLPPTRAVTISNGVDVDAVQAAKSKTDRPAKRSELGIPTDAIIIVSITRLVEWKGAPLLLDSFSQIAEGHPRAHLLLVGEGELKEKLQATATELHLEKRVHIFGARADAFEILAVSDIAALPFLYKPDVAGEAVGLAGLEAMAMGLPLIVSDYPSAHRFIEDGVSGVLIRPGDEQALVQALRGLTTDPVKRKELGSQGEEFIKSNFDWQKLVPIYEQIYYLLTNS